MCLLLVGLNSGEVLFGGELPVEEKLVERFLVDPFGLTTSEAETGIGWLLADVTGRGLSFFL